jgi:hypothetical protein
MRNDPAENLDKLLTQAQRSGYQRKEKRLPRAKLKRWRSGYEPRKRLVPRMATLKKLMEDIKGLPPSRKLRVGELRAWYQVVRALHKRQRRLETLCKKALHRNVQIQNQMRLTAKLANARTADQLLEFLLRRKGMKDGRNVNAVAIARLSYQRLKWRLNEEERHEHFARLGRAGMKKRWDAYRAAKTAEGINANDEGGNGTDAGAGNGTGPTQGGYAEPGRADCEAQGTVPPV